MAHRTDMSLNKEEQFCQVKPQCDNHSWLLDDHPLRSYPTQCIPALEPHVDKCYQSVQKRWKACLLGAVCLLCVGLAAFQFFRDLPFRTTQIMRRSASAAALSGRDYASSCILPHPDSLDVLPVSLAVGCVWLHEDKLQVGRPPSDPKARNAEQQQQPLDSLLFRLDAHNSQTPLTIDVSAIESHDDVPQSFLVTFDAQTPFPELYPDLVAQLDSLRQRGSLTHWEQGRIVQRPVTVVVTGEGISETDCSTSSYSDIFWIASPDELLDRRMSDVLSNVSPICLV